jgi:hypothetical protein
LFLVLKVGWISARLVSLSQERHCYANSVNTPAPSNSEIKARRLCQHAFKDNMHPDYEECRALSCGHAFHNECLQNLATVREVQIDDLKCPNCGRSSRYVAYVAEDGQGPTVEGGDSVRGSIEDTVAVEDSQRPADDHTHEPGTTNGIVGETDDAEGLVDVAAEGERIGLAEPAAAKSKAKAKRTQKAKESGAAAGSVDAGDGTAATPKAKGKPQARSKPKAKAAAKAAANAEADDAAGRLTDADDVTAAAADGEFGAEGNGTTNASKASVKARAKVKSAAKATPKVAIPGKAAEAKAAAHAVATSSEASATAAGDAGAIATVEAAADDGDEAPLAQSVQATATGKAKAKAKTKAKAKAKASAESSAKTEEAPAPNETNPFGVLDEDEDMDDADLGKALQLSLNSGQSGASLAFGHVTCTSCGVAVEYDKCRLVSKDVWRCHVCGVRITQLRRALGSWPTESFSQLSKVANTPVHRKQPNRTCVRMTMV